MDYLTWQSRCIELLSDAKGNVGRVIVTPRADLDGAWPCGSGLPLGSGLALRDPWLAYYVGSGLPPRLAAVRVEPEGSFWRDLPVLLRSTPYRRRPLVIDWLAEQSATGLIATRHVHGLTVLGLEGSGRRLDRWQRRQCQLPAALLGEGDCAADFHRALEWAGEYYEAMQAARWMMARGRAVGPPGRAPDEAALRRLARGATEGAGGGYWEALEAPAQLLAMRMQGEADERDETLRWWDGLCRRQAWVCLEREIDRAGGPGRLLRWEVTARRHLARCGPRGRSGQGTRGETAIDTAV